MYAHTYLCVYDRLYSVFAYKFPKSSIPTDSNPTPVSASASGPLNNTIAATAATTGITTAATAATTNGIGCNNYNDKGDITSMKENITPTNNGENASAVAVTPYPLTRHRKVVVFSQVLTYIHTCLRMVITDLIYTSIPMYKYSGRLCSTW